MDSSTYELLAKSRNSTTFKKLNGKKKFKQEGWTACEKLESFKCNFRLAKLQLGGVAMKFGKDGRLTIPDNFDPFQPHVAMECSDSCGCSDQCPQRPLQKGQSKHLFIYYEDENMEFGVRVDEPIKKGDLICVYTGKLSKDSDEDKDWTYAVEIGNFGSAFVLDADEYGRRYEYEPMIPRLTVYAMKDIAIGG